MPDRLEFVFAGVLLAAFVIFTLVIVEVSNTDQQLLSGLTTFFSTLLSICAALIIGRYLYRYQVRQSDKKRREELEELIRQELRGMLSTLQDLETIGHDGTREDVESSVRSQRQVYLSPIILEEASKSGLFPTELSYNFVLLSGYIHTHNMTMGMFHSSLSAGSPIMSAHANSVADIQNNIIHNCKALLSELEDEPDDLKTTPQEQGI